jgi:hypothetical protein
MAPRCKRARSGPGPCHPRFLEDCTALTHVGARIQFAKYIRDSVNPDTKIVHQEAVSDDPRKRRPDITRAGEILQCVVLPSPLASRWRVCRCGCMNMCGCVYVGSCVCTCVCV